MSTSASDDHWGAGWRVSAILVVLMLGLIGIDRVAAFGLGQAYEWSGESPLAQVRHAAADTVVVGTSTGRYALIADAWPDKLVNLSQDGQTISFSIAAAIAMRHAPTVKNVILALDPYDLQNGLENPSTERIWRIAPLIYNDPDTSELLTKTRPASSAPVALESWRFRGAVDKIFKKIGKLEPPAYRALPARPQKKPKLNRLPPETKPEIHSSLIKHIDALRRSLMAKGQVLTLVITPAYYNPRWNLPVIEPLVDAFVERLRGARVCNLTKLRGTEFEGIHKAEANFHDGIHMSRRGARAYTRMIARKIGSECSIS